MGFQTALDAVALGGLYALYALGIALVFGIMNLINFAQGEFIMAGQYAIFVLAGLGIFLPGVIALEIVVVVALALLTERAAFRPIRGANPATLLVTSFAVSYLLQNVASLIFTSTPKQVNVAPALNESITIAGTKIAKLDLVTIGVTGGILVGLAAFLRWTSIGAQMRAAAEDFEMARILSIRANRVIALAFALSGALAAIAAFLNTVRVGVVTPTSGLTPVVYAFIATLLGGVGSLAGPVIASFLLGALTVVLQVELPQDVLPYRDAFVFAAVFVILVSRPSGLIVSKSRMVRV